MTEGIGIIYIISGILGLIWTIVTFVAAWEFIKLKSSIELIYKSAIQLGRLEQKAERLEQDATRSNLYDEKTRKERLERAKQLRIKIEQLKTARQEKEIDL